MRLPVAAKMAFTVARLSPLPAGYAFHSNARA